MAGLDRTDDKGERLEFSARKKIFTNLTRKSSEDVHEGFLVFPDLEGLALFREPEELVLREPSLNIPLCLFLLTTLECVFLSALGLGSCKLGVRLARLLSGFGWGMCVELACPSSPEFRLRRDVGAFV